MLGFALALAVTISAQAAPQQQSASQAVEACLGTSRYAANLARLEALRTGLSDETWRDVCGQAQTANQRRLSVQEALRLTGSPPLGGYESAARHLQLARAATDPTVAELFRRTARDNATRSSLSSVDGAKTYARDLTPAALTLLDALVSADAVAVDADNREWLKGVLARRGWFTIGRDGPDADRAAWLMVQHADMDREFQRTTLVMLEPLAAAGETSRRGYAFLYDRWAEGAAQPQRFGLGGRCAGPGVWAPNAIEDAGNVDARRREAGLSPLAEHVAQMSRTCR